MIKYIVCATEGQRFEFPDVTLKNNRNEKDTYLNQHMSAFYEREAKDRKEDSNSKVKY